MFARWAHCTCTCDAPPYTAHLHVTQASYIANAFVAKSSCNANSKATAAGSTHTPDRTSECIMLQFACISLNDPTIFSKKNYTTIHHPQVPLIVASHVLRSCSAVAPQLLRMSSAVASHVLLHGRCLHNAMNMGNCVSQPYAHDDAKHHAQSRSATPIATVLTHISVI